LQGEWSETEPLRDELWADAGTTLPQAVQHGR
jgi:hypothetical protein